MTPTPNNLQLNHQWTSALTHQIADNSSDIFTFTPSHILGLDGAPVTTLFEKLFPDTTNRNIKAVKQALQTAILCLYQSIEHSHSPITGFTHSRTNTRTKLAERYRTNNYNAEILTRVLDRLSEAGLVMQYKGFRGKGYSKGLATLFIPTDIFYKWMYKHKTELSITQFMKYRELVILKDTKKRLKEYPETDFTKAMRQRIREYNELRQQHRWRYIPLDKAYWHVSSNTRKAKKEYSHYVEGLNPSKELNREDLECVRIFSEDFKSAGRFFCSAQNLNKHERATLTIDNRPTVEIDLKSLHPRLLYNLNGLEAPEDCYAADTIEQRKLNKRISMFVLNCASHNEAHKALMSDQIISSQKAQEAIQAFVSRHTPIANHFFKRAWATLQYVESKITDNILAQCYIRNIPVLPVHDSYIVETKHAFNMINIITSTYKKITGFNPVLSF
ncbi:hypothetical protein [Marinomonas arenicola]|uniref:DNA-directed DNA polymerase family A palm domain-containing protein n=1 Tax=Marinomonas arenicola TaxID=569601 RepID=A0ABU9G4E6_9GAMM